MKNYKYYLGIVGLLCGLWACNDDWDNHYSERKTVIENAEISIVSGSAINYLKGQESYSKFSGLLDDAGITGDLQTKASSYTILAISNDIVDTLLIQDTVFWAKTYITNVALSPSSLTEGQRVMMWNGKYLEVNFVVNPITEDTNVITINQIPVSKIVKTDDGYIYELAGGLNILQSMYEVIQSLDDDNYSTFKRLLSQFNKEASTPKGVDADGNTIYDSVFVVSSPAGFDLTSESINGTMLIPSNKVIAEALDVAYASLENWGLSREDSVLQNWLYRAMLFDKAYTPEDFEANEDLTSVYSQQWRTTVQEVDLERPLQMSNGVAYYVTKLKIPTNVLIYRLKDFFYYYEYASEEEKGRYFVEENLTFQKCSTLVTAWTPAAGVWPIIENRALRYDWLNEEVTDFTLDFTPIRCSEKEDGSYDIQPYLIPPGEYRLCMGFAQNFPATVTIGFNGTDVGAINSFSNTDYHYDRGGEGYPEGYVPSNYSHSKKGNYDRDGGFVAVVTVPEGDAKPVKITIKGVKANYAVLTFHHWCLRPTSDNY